MTVRRQAAAWLTLLLLTGCSGAAQSSSDQQTSEPVTTTGSADEAEKEDGKKDEQTPAKSAKLLATGFGQLDQYVWVSSLVQNLSEDNVGRFVTIQFNVLDNAGEILTSTDQVEIFSRKGQKMAIGTQVDLDRREKAARVEATMEVGNESGSSDPAPEIPTGKVKVVRDEYGGTEARFQLENPTAKSLKSPRVGVICFSAKDAVIGGGVDFPELVPPSGKRLVAVPIITRGRVDRCEAYAGPGL